MTAFYIFISTHKLHINNGLFIYKDIVYFDKDRVSLVSQPNMQVSPVRNQCPTEKIVPS